MNSKQFGGLGILAFLSFILYYYVQTPSHSIELLVQWSFGVMIVFGFLVAIALNVTALSLQALFKTAKARRSKAKPEDIADYNKKLAQMQAKPQFSHFRVLVLFWQFGLAYNLMAYGFDATSILYVVMIVLVTGSEYRLRKSAKPL